MSPCNTNIVDNVNLHLLSGYFQDEYSFLMFQPWFQPNNSGARIHDAEMLIVAFMYPVVNILTTVTVHCQS